MKIGREKRIRSEYIKQKIEQIVTQITKSVGHRAPEGEEVGGVTPRKSPKNICQETGRARGLVKGYKVSRHIYRRKADQGQLEGVRRGT
jgi:ribosomal protein S14